jgi:hypothetical protein
MPHRGRHEQLDENQRGDAENSSGARRPFHRRSRSRVLPPPGCDQGDPADRDEKQLGRAGVDQPEDGAQRGVEHLMPVQHHPKAAEQSLRKDQRQRAPGQLPDPGSSLRELGPDCQDDGEESHAARDQPMQVLVVNPANAPPAVQRQEEHVVAVTGRPIRHRHSDALARHQSAETNQNQRGHGGQNRMAMQPTAGVIGF